DPNSPKDQYGRPTVGRRASWVVMLFPYMENNALWDEWSSNFTANPSAPAMANMTCPSHPPETQGLPWLAYVGNAGQGYSDSTRGTDDHEYAADGVFVDDARNSNLISTSAADGKGDGAPPNPSKYPRIQMTMNYISSADGTSKTLMFSENLHTWYWTYDAV